jgi:hypothetical protein
MKDSYSEGVANHTDPESCGCDSNDMVPPSAGLTGERMGRVLSREIPIFQGADVVGWYGRQYRMYRNREIHSDSARSETLSTYGSIRTEEQYRDKLKLQKKGIMHDLLTGKVRVKSKDNIIACQRRIYG